MKTPDEIKKGLGCMSNSDIECNDCPYRDDNYLFCSTGIVKDAIACINQLEADNKILEIVKEEFIQLSYRLEAERDALLQYLTDSAFAPCDICKHDTGEGVMGCNRIREVGIPCFEWRGISKEKEEKHER